LLARDYNAVADWPQFRGPQAAALMPENRWPLEWNVEAAKMSLANTSAGFGARLTIVSGDPAFT